MSKRALKLSVKIPNFMTGRGKWRRAIHAAVAAAQDKRTIAYGADDKLEVQIRFYLRDRKLTILDIDNRVKDLLDALQGFVGDKGKTYGLHPIIPNDNQVYRIVAEKRLPPKASRDALSTVVVRKYRNHGATARSHREFRKHLPGR
jgi:hypothetical protein